MGMTVVIGTPGISTAGRICGNVLSSIVDVPAIDAYDIGMAKEVSVCCKEILKDIVLYFRT